MTRSPWNDAYHLIFQLEFPCFPCKCRIRILASQWWRRCTCSPSCSTSTTTAILDLMNCEISACRWHIADDRQLRSHKTFYFTGVPEKPPTCLQSWTQVNFASLPASKAFEGLLLPMAYVLICRNSTLGSTGGCVAGSSAAYENQGAASIVKEENRAENNSW